MSENRYAWLRTVIGQFVIMHYPDDPLNATDEDSEGDNEYGPTVRLILPRQSGPPLRYNFTALTFEELKMTREFFNLLFDLAEPVVRERDRMAQDAFDAGDDSFARIYRQVPQYVVRGRKGGADGQGIRDRPSDDAGGPPRDGDPADGVRVDGAELADGDSKHRGSQDDDATAD
jgi:hypothetical protein